MNQLVQLYQALQNPQQFVKDAMGAQQIKQNPIAMNALNMIQSGDSDGLQKLARNMCKERGINADEAINQLKSQIGL